MSSIKKQINGPYISKDPGRDGEFRRRIDWNGRHGQDVRRQTICSRLEVSVVSIMLGLQRLGNSLGIGKFGHLVLASHTAVLSQLQ